jgi:phenylpropionate dioxygenase-like ring-hydroxylating dioxygenase large terminal subunit
MYLRNSWYVIAWSRDVADRPFARTVLDEPVVVYRGEDGKVAALEDHCPHRHLPLSKGAVVGDNIQCGYHGMIFNRAGACVGVPSQTAVPPRARVKSYPAEERYGWIWVWMGEAEKADPALIPDFSLMTAPGFRTVGATKHVLASYKLVTDNLMDLSHVGYVHQTTIGNPQFTEKGKLKSQKTANGVRVERIVPDVPPPPTYVMTGRLPEGKNIDRWQIIDFVAPSSVMIHVGGAEVGTGGLEGRYEHGLNIWVMNAMTPETEHTCHYFWGSTRNHAIDSKAADELFFDQVSKAFDEDAAVLEAQQLALMTRKDSWDIALKADAGSIESRRVLDGLIAREQAAIAEASAGLAAE